MIHQEIRCDECGKVGTGNGTSAYGRWRAHVARQNLHASGWDVGLKGGRDVCAHCAHAPDDPPPWDSGCGEG